MEPSDAELISLYRGGDIGALECLITRYQRPLYSYILGMGRAGTDADDVFQEVWLRAIRTMTRYRQKNLLAWLMRIAHNHIVDEFRKKRPVLTLDEELEGGENRVDRLESSVATPDKLLLADEIGARIEAALLLLPDEQKEVFLLRTTAEMPFKEIARIQRVPINTALARMQYALARLRGLLADDYVSLGHEVRA